MSLSPYEHLDELMQTATPSFAESPARSEAMTAGCLESEMVSAAGGVPWTSCVNKVISYRETQGAAGFWNRLEQSPLVYSLGRVGSVPIAPVLAAGALAYFLFFRKKR